MTESKKLYIPEEDEAPSWSVLLEWLGRQGYDHDLLTDVEIHDVEAGFRTVFGLLVKPTDAYAGKGSRWPKFIPLQQRPVDCPENIHRVQQAVLARDYQLDEPGFLDKIATGEVSKESLR